jgi:hypothetical protein
VYESVIDRDSRDAGHEPELTPIFHALSRRATDPVERFRRDPLRAPLPAAAQPSQLPAMTRMLLSAVPARQVSRQGAHRAPHEATQRAGGAHCAQEAHAHRGGRHRALRAVERDLLVPDTRVH